MLRLTALPTIVGQVFFGMPPGRHNAQSSKRALTVTETVYTAFLQFLPNDVR